MCLDSKNWVDLKPENHVKGGSKLDRRKCLGRSNCVHVNTWIDPKSIPRRPITQCKQPIIISCTSHR